MIALSCSCGFETVVLNSRIAWSKANAHLVGVTGVHVIVASQDTVTNNKNDITLSHNILWTMNSEETNEPETA